MSSATPRQVVALLALGVVGVLIAGLQPQLLGALAAEGRLSVTALGPLATVELLAMGVAAGGASFVLPIDRLRSIAVAALLTIAAADLATPRVGVSALFALRVVAGVGEGVLVWLAIGFIVRTAHPERWSGIYLAVQTLAQFAVASALGYAAAGSGLGFAALAAISLLALAAVPFVPAAFVRIDVGDTGSAMPPLRGVATLAGVLLYLAFIVAMWVYVEPLAAERAVPARLIHVIAPLSLACQVLGAGAATLLAERLRAPRVLTSCVAANLALLAVMGAPPSPAAFVAATAAFGFLWLFAMPFQVPLVINADPSRRAAMMIGGAQLAGSSLGPLLAGAAVGAHGVGAVPWLGAAVLCAGAALLLVAGRRA